MQETLSTPTPTTPAQPGPAVQTEGQQVASSTQSYQYAGFWLRWAAGLADGVILVIPIFVILTILGVTVIGIGKSGSASIINVLPFLVYLPADIFFITKFGATPGKMVFHLKIIRGDGSNPQLKTAILRETVGRILSGIVFNLGYLWIAFDKQKQGWHDKIAGTHVILTEPLGKGRKILIFILVFILFALPIIGIIALYYFISSIFAPARGLDSGGLGM